MAEALGEALGGAGRGEMQGAEEVERGPGPRGAVLEEGADGGGEFDRGRCKKRFEEGVLGEAEGGCAGEGPGGGVGEAGRPRERGRVGIAEGG